MLLHVGEHKAAAQSPNSDYDWFYTCWGNDLSFCSSFPFFLDSGSDLFPNSCCSRATVQHQIHRLTSLTIRDGSNLQNFPRKLGSAVFLKVQGKSPSKSTFQSLRRALDLLWQITEGWIDKTHLHCSEMAAALTSKGSSPLQGSDFTQETASNGQKCA